MYALRIAGVAIALERIPRRLDVLLEQLGYRILSCVDGDDAPGGIPLAVAVAAPRGLQNRIQTGHLPVDRREIHVHARLNQRGGDHPAGQAVLQALANDLQNRLAMGRAHQRGQVKAALPRQQRMDFLGRLSAVDDAQHLMLGAQLVRQRRIGAHADAAEGDAPEAFVQLRGVGADFPHRDFRREGRNQVAQNRLGGRAQHRRGPEIRNQGCNRTHAGQQGLHGQHLRLVKDDYAVGDVVQLPALGGAVGIDGFKELHSGGHNHRRVPVFGGKARAALFAVHLLVRIENRAAVVLDDVVLPQYAPKDEGVLLDDGGVGDHVDDAPHAVLQGVPQREGQRSNGLAAARGHGQRVDSPWVGARLRAALQNPAAQAVQFALGRVKARNVPLQPFPEFGQGIISSALNLPAGHELLGVQVVRIHQAGIEHPRPQGQAIAVIPEIRLRRAGGQLSAPPAGRLGTLHALLQPSTERRVSGHVHVGIPIIRQAAVVPDHAAGGHPGSDPRAFDGASGRVVDLRPIFHQPPLEGSCGLADVVGQTHQPAEVLAAKFCGECGAAPCSALQMGVHRLFPAVPGDMGQKNRASHVHPSM